MRGRSDPAGQITRKISQTCRCCMRGYQRIAVERGRWMRYGDEDSQYTRSCCCISNVRRRVEVICWYSYDCTV